MPRQTSIQLTEATERQIAALRAQGYGTATDVIRLAVDRMYQAEGDPAVTVTPRKRVILSHQERDDIIAWATPRAVMQAGELVNTDEIVAQVAAEFDVPEHTAKNAVAHMVLRLRKPG